MASTIENVLIGKIGSRLTIGDRWLVWNKSSQEWVVYKSHFGHSTGTVEYAGSNKAKALQILIKEA